MSIENIQKSINDIDAHFHKKFSNSSEYERLLSRTVKLSEEVGELCEAVLNEGNEQRAEKSEIDFEGEVADVIICTLMIAKTKEIEVWSEVQKKLEKIKTRHNIIE